MTKKQDNKNRKKEKEFYVYSEETTILRKRIIASSETEAIKLAENDEKGWDLKDDFYDGWQNETYAELVND